MGLQMPFPYLPLRFHINISPLQCQHYTSHFSGAPGLNAWIKWPLRRHLGLNQASTEGFSSPISWYPPSWKSSFQETYLIKKPVWLPLLSVAPGQKQSWGFVLSELLLLQKSRSMPMYSPWMLMTVFTRKAFTPWQWCRAFLMDSLFYLQNSPEGDSIIVPLYWWGKKAQRG